MILESVLQNLLADLIDTEVNNGAGNGSLIFETSGDGEVATIAFQATAFSAAAAGVITLQGVTLSDTDATGGTIAQASIFDGDATKQLEMTCGVSAEEIVITSVVIVATEQVDLTALTLTVPVT